MLELSVPPELAVRGDIRPVGSTPLPAGRRPDEVTETETEPVA